MQSAVIGRYHFGFSQPLAPEQLAALVRLIDQPVQRDQSPLSGRGGVAVRPVHGLGSVVVKRYLRGGILRFLNSRLYLRLGKVRPQLEFELLERVRALGVQAPEPIAFAHRGGLWYQGWLFMREIPVQGRLTDASVIARYGAEAVIHELARQTRILIEHGLLHTDFHPGNVLIDTEGAVHLIDFDNARIFSGSARELRDVYLRRWRRAVIKHALPETLSELMAMELRQVAALGR